MNASCHPVSPLCSYPQFHLGGPSPPGWPGTPVGQGWGYWGSFCLGFVQVFRSWLRQNPPLSNECCPLDAFSDSQTRQACLVALWPLPASVTLAAVMLSPAWEMPDSRMQLLPNGLHNLLFSERLLRKRPSSCENCSYLGGLVNLSL